MSRLILARTMVTATAVLLAGVAALPANASQQPAHEIPWYIARRDRERLYKRVEINASSRRSGAFLTGLWITPEIARALVSFGVDDEKISRDVAEDRLRQLRHDDCHMLLLRTYQAPFGTPDTRRSIRLATKDDKVGVEGTILKPTFKMPYLRDSTRAEPGFIVCFPRVNSRGEPIIRNLESEVSVVVEFTSEKLYLRAKARRFASWIGDL